MWTLNTEWLFLSLFLSQFNRHTHTLFLQHIVFRLSDTHKISLSNEIKEKEREREGTKKNEKIELLLDRKFKIEKKNGRKEHHSVKILISTFYCGKSGWLAEWSLWHCFRGYFIEVSRVRIPGTEKVFRKNWCLNRPSNWSYEKTNKEGGSPGLVVKGWDS